jgi:dephospho-CoA kinase
MTMLIVALTGGIGTGKSVVAGVLEQGGCYIYAADKVAHELMKPSQPAWQKIVSHFGPEVLNSDQTINRSRLGAIVFSDEKERQFLNSVVHPLVLKKRKEVIQQLEKKGAYKIFVSEAALTIESGFAPFFDKFIVVYCSKDTQIQRLMERDQISRLEALKKIRSQMPSQEKRRYADYAIETSGSLDETIKQAKDVYKHLFSDYRRKLKKEKRKQPDGSRPRALQPKAES